MQMHETDWVEDSGISEMSTLALNFAVTFSQPRVMNVTGSSGGCDKKGRAWTCRQWAMWRSSSLLLWSGVQVHLPIFQAWKRSTLSKILCDLSQCLKAGSTFKTLYGSNKAFSLQVITSWIGLQINQVFLKSVLRCWIKQTNFTLILWLEKNLLTLRAALMSLLWEREVFFLLLFFSNGCLEWSFGWVLGFLCSSLSAPHYLSEPLFFISIIGNLIRGLFSSKIYDSWGNI